MLIDYSERMSAEENTDKRSVYREVIRDLGLALDIEPNQISIIQEVSNLIK